MMHYGLESLEMKPGEVDDREWKEPISAGAHLYIFSEALQGVIESLAKRLVSKGLSKEEINGKMVELLNLFTANGDMSEQFKKWMLEEDFANPTWDVRDNLYKVEPQDRWDSWWKIKDRALDAVDYGNWRSEFKKKMNDREKELLENFERTREEAYKARRAYEEYIENNAVDAIQEIFTKYGETFSKIDEEWYKGVELRLRDEVERVKKRRAEKKAEMDATASRATPVGTPPAKSDD